MNMPKIGQNIIVRKANGYLPTHLKNSIQIVTDTETDAAIHEEGNGGPSSRGPVVRFQPTAGGIYYTSQWDIVPAIGDKVRAVGNVLIDYNGHECVITDIYPGIVAYSLTGEFKSIQKPDDTISLSFSEWEPIDEPAAPAEDPEITRLKQRIEALEKQLADTQHDFHHVTKSLLTEADRRGWCGEYDEFVDETQGGLRVMTMPTREKEYAVTWTTQVVVSVGMSRTYTAESPEAAEDMARGDYYTDAETQQILDAVRSGDWEEITNTYDREYEVEEVCNPQTRTAQSE